MPMSIGPVGHDYKLPLSDTITVSDTRPAMATGQLHADTITVSDSDTKKISQAHADTITVSDSDTKKVFQVHADVMTMSDIYARVFDATRAFADTITMSAVCIRKRKRFRVFTDTITISDTRPAFLVGKCPIDTITMSDTFTRDWDLARALTDTVTLTDDIIPYFYDKNNILNRADIQTDFSTVLADILTEDVTLRQVAVTTDALGNPATATNTDVTIDCGIKYLTETDRQIIGAGTAIRGELVGYFKHVYTVASVDYTVAVGDIIIRNSIAYRITKLFGRFKLGSTVIYIKGLLERL